MVGYWIRHRDFSSPYWVTLPFWAVTLIPLRFPGYSLPFLGRLIWDAQHMRGQRVLIKIIALACLLPLTWTNLQDCNGGIVGYGRSAKWRGVG